MGVSKRSFLKLTSGAFTFPTVSSSWAQSPIGKRRLMQGPMLGPAYADSLVVWARVSGPLPVQIQYGRSPYFDEPGVSQAVMAKPEDDHTVRIVIDGLRPSTTYYYRVLVDGNLDGYQANMPPFKMRTAPESSWRGRFKAAFGSCARIQEDAEQLIWRHVERVQPDLFFWLGDNIYADSHSLDIFQEEYRRQRLVPALQPVLRSVPQLATWDDHDYGLNNHDRTSPVKEVGLAAFKQYWANPTYGLPGSPGVFFKYNYGGIDFFFLDGRFYRDPNSDTDGQNKTMLGATQLSWLKEELLASKAIFKVLVSGSGWSSAKGPGGDAWSSFISERDALFGFIRDNGVSGVVLLSGDTHVAEANCIPFSEKGGYDMYDLTSSPLAQTPGDDWQERRPEIRIRNPVFESSNFGVLQFDTAATDPTVTYSIHDVNGRVPRRPIVIKASDLKNGVTSWNEKSIP